MHIAKGGVSWIITAFFLCIIFGLLSLLSSNRIQQILFFSTIVFGLLTVLFIVFFRDPNRLIGSGIVAVADGTIRSVKSIEDEDVGSAWFISTFMNIYHVHVNRMPIEGTIQTITHITGSHLPAFTKESERNERVILLVKTKIGLVKIILIAGTLARRIVPYVKKGNKVKKGEKISLIRLGSRVDIYIPKKEQINIHVKEKDHMKAGGSMIASPDV